MDELKPTLGLKNNWFGGAFRCQVKFQNVFHNRNKTVKMFYFSQVHVHVIKITRSQKEKLRSNTEHQRAELVSYYIKYISLVRNSLYDWKAFACHSWTPWLFLNSTYTENMQILLAYKSLKVIGTCVDWWLLVAKYISRRRTPISVTQFWVFPVL